MRDFGAYLETHQSVGWLIWGLALAVSLLACVFLG